MKRFVATVLALVVLIGVGVVAACVLLSDVDVRRLMKVPPETPDPVAWYFGIEEEDPRQIVPLDKMGAMKGPNRFRRASWEGAERGQRPSDPRTDPLHGTTQIMFFHTALEMRLSSTLRQSRLPLKILKVGITERVPARFTRSGSRTAPRGGICYVEVYSGDPVSRTAVEETADRVLDLAFSTVPQIDEVDLEVVPWRTAPGHKPPSWFSVDATRADYVAIPGVRSHMENLRASGAVWCDPRVMSDFP